MAQSTPPSDVNATSNIGPLFDMLVQPATCSCINGGICIDEMNLICQCPTGFEGTRCEKIYIDFSFGQSPGIRLHPDAIVGIAISALIVLILVVSGFMIRRRCNRSREKRRWVQWQEGRSQSKATIEGFTVVEPKPMSKQIPAKFGIKIFKNLNHKRFFQLRPGVSQDVETQKTNTGGFTAIGRNQSVPDKPCSPSDSQSQLDVDDQKSSRVSVISRGSDVAPVTSCTATDSSPKLNHCDSAEVGQARPSAPVASNSAVLPGKPDDFSVEKEVVLPHLPKSSRRSLPNALASSRKPPHAVTRTRRLSFAPTVQEVVHI